MLRRRDDHETHLELSQFLLEVPHTCSDPTCPGNINRQKLELFDELVRQLKNTTGTIAYTAGEEWDTVKLARAVLAHVAAIPAPTQGGESV